MKKTIVWMLAIMMLLCTAACAQKPAATTAEAPVAEAAADEIKFVEEGKLLVSLCPDFSPMEFVDTSKSGQDQYVGFDVTLAKYIADELGLELEIKPMSFDACQTAVQLGAVDMSISGYSVTDERLANYCLSDYYYAGENETEQTIIVPADKAGTFSKVEDFAGMKVAAQATSLQESLCNENLADIAASIELFKSIDDAVLALKTGKVDAIAVATGNGEAIIASNPDIGMSGFLFEIDEAAANNVIMLNKSATALTETVNEILAKAYAGGFYGEWYAAAQELAGIDTAADISYDEEGNVAAG